MCVRARVCVGWGGWGGGGACGCDCQCFPRGDHTDPDTGIAGARGAYCDVSAPAHGPQRARPGPAGLRQGPRMSGSLFAGGATGPDLVFGAAALGDALADAGPGRGGVRLRRAPGGSRAGTECPRAHLHVGRVQRRRGCRINKRTPARPGERLRGGPGRPVCVCVCVCAFRVECWGWASLLWPCRKRPAPGWPVAGS